MNRLGFQNYILATAILITSFLLQELCKPFFGNVSLLLVYPAVFITGWYCGYRASNWTIVLACLGTNYFFYEPRFTFRIEKEEDLFRLASFFISMIFINWLINKRKKVEFYLEERARQYELLVESMPQLVWITDTQGRILYINQRWYEYTGQPPESLSPETWTEVTHPEDRERVWIAHKEALRNFSEFNTEYRLRNKDGQYRWHIARTIFVKDSFGKYTQRFGTAIDIHDRKIAEAQASSSAQLLQMITNRLPAFISYMDSDHRYSFVNRTYEQWFGLNSKQIQGKTRQELLGNSQTYDYMKPHEEKAFAGEESRFEMKIVNTAGDPHYLVAEFLPDLDPQTKNVKGIIGVAHDVTDFTLARKDLEKLTEELQKAVEARDVFLSIASHELRTPLTGMKLQTQILKRRVEKKDESVYQPESLHKILNQFDHGLLRMTHLIDDMLDISRIQTGRLHLAKEETDIANFTEESIKAFEPQLVNAGINPIFENLGTAKLSIDRFRMEQVFTNLITNAARYAPNSDLRICIQNSSDMYQIRFADKGPGVAEENQERIFNRFERVVSANEISGLGLGLFIAREIVQAHGGFLKVESKLGEGSTFIIELPYS